MRLSFWATVIGTAALATISYIGFRLSRPVNTRLEWMTLFVSLAGLLGSAVVFVGGVIREAIKRFRCSDSTAEAFFRHFTAVGLSASFMALVGFGGLAMMMITFHPGPASDFIYSDQQQKWSALGATLFSVFFWPARRLTMLTGHVTPGWLAWLLCSLIYGLVLYALTTVIRLLLTRIHNRPVS